MEQYNLDITDSQITFSKTDNPNTIEYVMMDWEDNLMKYHANLVCHNKGEVLEFGFGLGISATYIQSHNPKSHTIIETHPQIIEKAKLWALDKPNVKIVEGDWIESFNQLDKYDGIFFDTYGDDNYLKFGEKVKLLVKPGAHVTWWNAIPNTDNVYGFEDVIYTKYDVDPPKNNYFIAKEYYLPLKIFI